MKIYTRSGDEGETGLFGGGRVLKSHLRVAAYGAVDELNAVLGVAVASVADDEIGSNLIELQQDLFSLGASLATPGAEQGSARPATPALPLPRIQEMEGWIDAATDETPPLKNFILPGGSRGAATLHLARTVCRRAERAVVRLGQEESIDLEVVRYLNRLSDLLFTYARLENHRAGVPDVLWQKDPG
ncbi:MAG: cob(I)yrinic acid a,c-diamide adenosyltransferase [Longimicrobiales bacterium]